MEQITIEQIKKAAEDASGNAAKLLKEEINTEIKSLRDQLETSQKEGVKKESLESLKQNIIDLNEKLDTLDKKAQKKNVEEKSFSEALSESLNLNKDAIYKLKGDKSSAGVNFNLELKAAGTMTRGNYTGGVVGLTTFDPMFARVVRRQPFLRQLVTVRPLSSAFVSWAEQANLDGGAGNTAEGAAKTQADFDIVEASKKVEKITSYIKVSKEALDDIPFLQSEINTELVELLTLKLDTDLLSGSGTSPVISGILGYATTFVPAAPFLNAVEQANEFDVIRAAVGTLAKNSYNANYVLLNPATAAMMDMVKVSPTDGRYVLPPFYSADGQRIAGLEVVTNPGVAVGDFVIGDFTKSNLGIREELNIQVGYENDDFTKNLITILGELRAVHYIKTNHLGAFLKGTFATVKTALEKA